MPPADEARRWRMGRSANLRGMQATRHGAKRRGGGFFLFFGGGKDPAISQTIFRYITRYSPLKGGYQRSKNHLNTTVMVMDKINALLALGKERRESKPPLGSKAIGDFHNGIYDCKYVSPFTIGAHNENAKIFLLLQDWDSQDDMNKSEIDPIEQANDLTFGYDPNQATNKNLAKLLCTHFKHLEIAETYGTNLYPYIKPGAKDNYIPKEDLLKAANKFALPQIKIVDPKLVVCLGISTFNAVRKACKLKNVNIVEEGIKKPFSLYNSQVWLQTHPSPQAQNQRGKIKVNEDWKRMADWYYSLG